MRTTKTIKYIIFLLIIYILTTSVAFAYDESTALPAAYFNIQSLSYKPVITNTETNFAEAITSKSVKAIELIQLSNDTTNDENYWAIPHINVENYTAELSNNLGDIVICRLLAKVVINFDPVYNSMGTTETWFEITDVKTYIYNRTNIDNRALNFTITLYYVFDSTSSIGSTNEYLSLDTGGSTNFYLFYLLGNDELPFYYGTLTGSIVTPTTPEFSPVPNTYLNINVSKPTAWTQTGFFETLGSNYLQWIVSLQTGYDPTTTPPTTTEYRMGLKITSQNGFKLISTDAGTGIKEVQYTIKLSKRSIDNTDTVDALENEEIRIVNIKNNEPRVFYIYTNSTFTDTAGLNSGRFSDNIYLNFVSDIDNTFAPSIDKRVLAFAP